MDGIAEEPLIDLAVVVVDVVLLFNIVTDVEVETLVAVEEDNVVEICADKVESDEVCVVIRLVDGIVVVFEIVVLVILVTLVVGSTVDLFLMSKSFIIFPNVLHSLVEQHFSNVSTLLLSIYE